MACYEYYLVDCSGRSGALKIDNARLVKCDDVLGFVSEHYQKHLKQNEASRISSVKWSEERGGNTEAVNALYDKWSTKEHFYEHFVKCYPIDSFGRIIKDHNVIGKMWLSYEE